MGSGGAKVSGALVRDRVCAVLTAFHPGDGFEVRLQRLRGLVGGIVVVDNGGDLDAASWGSWWWLDASCRLISNPHNAGVPRALNQGVEAAIALGFPWILTLDQDTSIDAELLDVYREFVEAHPTPDRIGILGTNYREPDGQSAETPPKGDSWRSRALLITSGSLFAAETFGAAGPFPEAYFVDWADHAFALAVLETGRINYFYCSPLMMHALGNRTYHRFLGLGFHTNHHSAFRCYLIGRNLLALLRRFGRRHPGSAVFFLAALCYKPLAVMLWEQGRDPKLRAFFRGVKDGLMGRMDRHRMEESDSLRGSSRHP